MTASISNEQLKITVNYHGAELCSVMDQETKEEYIWQADKAFWGRHAPVLFPFVGSLKDKKYMAKEQNFEMGQHGFARDMEFNLEEQKENEIWFSLSSDQTTLEKYPYEFKLMVGYILDGRTVTVAYKVVNSSKETIYFGIGAHPAFNCNYIEKPCYFRFDHIKSLKAYYIDTTCGLKMANAKEVALDYIDKEYGYVKLSRKLFEHDALIIEKSGITEVALCNEEKQPMVKANFDAELFGLWSPAGKDAPFACIEPWYGRCDAIDAPYEIEKKEYINELEAGKEFERSYQLEF